MAETQYLFEPYNGNIVVDKDSEGKVIDKVMVNDKQMCRVVADGNLIYEKHPSWVWKNNSSSSVKPNSYHTGQCTLCGDTQKELHHWPTTPTFQGGVYHRYSCTAKDKKGKQCLKYYDEKHSDFIRYEPYQYNPNQHASKCSKCNHILGLEYHTFSGEGIDQGVSGHKRVCTLCNYTVEEDHNFAGVKAYSDRLGRFVGKCKGCSHTTNIANWVYYEDVPCNAEYPDLKTTIKISFYNGKLHLSQPDTVRDIVYKVVPATGTNDLGVINNWYYKKNGTSWQYKDWSNNIYYAKYKKMFDIGYNYPFSIPDLSRSTVSRFSLDEGQFFEYIGYFRETLNGPNIETTSDGKYTYYFSRNGISFGPGGFGPISYYADNPPNINYLVFPGSSNTYNAHNTINTNKSNWITIK